MRMQAVAVAAVLMLTIGARAAGEIVWHDAGGLCVEGRAWRDLASLYDRLPARAEGVVRDPVWRLSRHAAGLAVRFVSDATEIHVRWTLRNPDLAMPHMPATGVSGVDLYARDATGAWRWVAAAPPRGVENEARVAHGLEPGRREYLLYLPLYNGVRAVAVGVEAGRTVAAAPARPSGRAVPIVFYGTSITHGACASRPGMAHVAVLGRRFDRPVVNLGFSGQGRMDAEMADLLAEVDAAAYVVDCLPNMDGALVAERAAPFVRRLRRARPETPIILVEDRTFADAVWRRDRRVHHEASRSALREAFETLRGEGVTNLRLLRGADLLGADGEATVDASHPTDLGFKRQANAFAPVLAEALAGAGGPRAAGPERLEDYDRRTIAGFTVRVNRRFVRLDPDLLARVLVHLGSDLDAIAAFLPRAALAALRADVVIWVEHQGTAATARAGRGLCCHWSPAWLREHGLLEAKAGGVEIINPSDYIDWQRQQPFMLFHELAHAYHWRIGGHDDAIETRWRAATGAGRYDAVPRNSLPGGETVRAYAATNSHEYFAELSEAAFALNDFYPYSRSQLAAHDPEGLALLERLWGLDAAAIAAARRERP